MPKKAQHKWHQHAGLKCQQITANSHLHMSWNTQRPLLRTTALYSKEKNNTQDSHLKHGKVTDAKVSQCTLTDLTRGNK